MSEAREAPSGAGSSQASPLEARPQRSGSQLRRLLIGGLLTLIPLILVGPGLLSAKRFVPWLPVQLAPLAGEFPEAAAAAEVGTNRSTFDRLFPTLSDQWAFAETERVGFMGSWEPRIGLGIPLLGNSIAGPLYPPNLLARVLTPQRAAAPLAMLTLFLAGLGVWCFLARLGLSTPACIGSALGVQAAGFGVTNLFYPMKVDAVIWLPFAWFAIEGIVRGSGRSRTRSVGLLALSIGLPLLAGFPPIALFAAVAAGGYGLLAAGPWRWVFGLPGRARRGSWIRLALGFGLGCVLALVQLVPTALASFDSHRMPKTAVELRAQALPPSTLLALPLPDAYGAPTADRPMYGPALAWWTNPAERSGQVQGAQALEWNTYPGLGALLLSLVALIAGGRAAIPPLLFVLLFVGFAQGWPLIRLAYHFPPLAGGEPGRALAVVWLAFGWLGAVGCEALLRRKPRAMAAAGLAAALALLCGGWLAFGPLNSDAWTQAVVREHGYPLEEVQKVITAPAAEHALGQMRRAGQLQLMFGASLLVLIWLSGTNRKGAGPSQPHRRRILYGAVVALLALAEAALFSADHTRPSQVVQDSLLPVSESIEALREATGDGRVVRVDTSGGISELERLARPNLLQAYGINDLTGYVPFSPRGWVDLTERIDPASRHISGFAALTTPTVLDAPLLDLLRVTSVLSVREIDHPRLELVHRAPGFFVHRRSGALPPARLVQTELTFPDRDALLAAVAERDVDFMAATHTLREPGRRLAPASAAAGPAPVAAIVERPRAGRIRVRLPQHAGGLLVVHDQFTRGWHARGPDGDLEVFEADGAFLAVEVTEDMEQVEFRYAPREDRLAASASLLAALVILLLLAGVGRRAERTAA